VFERICVPPIEPAGTQFDLGLVAESLLFYRETYLIVAGNNLTGLVRLLGPDLLFRLVDEHQLQIRFIDHNIGAIARNKGTPFARYDVGLIHAEKHSLESAAQNAFVEVTGKSGRGRRLAARFCRSVSPIKYAESITNRITEDMTRGIFLEEFIKRRLVTLGAVKNTQDLPTFKYRFQLDPGQGFALDTDLGLERINSKFSEVSDPSSVLAQYGATVANMSLWAQISSEVAVYPRQGDVIAARLEPMLKEYSRHQREISAYQEFILDDSKAIREAINSGARTFDEFIPVLERAKRFKEWLSDLSEDTSLIKQYHKDVTSDSWIDRLPGKSSRWVLFTAAGIGIDAAGAAGVGTAAGVAISALDTFFMDRLLKGWKPHQYIEGPVRKFVDK
jgi:hypothetical protein